MSVLNHGTRKEKPSIVLYRTLVCGYESLVLRLVQQGLGHKGFRRSQLWFPSRKRLGFRHGDQFLLRAHGELRPLHGPCGRYGYG